MERETHGTLAFLNVLVNRREDGTLGHKVYKKLTHTDRFLNKISNHQPQQKRRAIKTLVERARRIYEPESLPEELSHLKNAFKRSGFSEGEFEQAIRPRRENTKVTPSRLVKEKAFRGRIFLC
ncbi:uncharacterized protein [Leptinotarsa decemlineata]|uniref:uncharacterized protein n=1 Tax=Leptinotarsa decemlineata TaxID=7539 RepID=UPI003D307520